MVREVIFVNELAKRLSCFAYPLYLDSKVVGSQDRALFLLNSLALFIELERCDGHNIMKMNKANRNLPFWPHRSLSYKTPFDSRSLFQRTDPQSCVHEKRVLDPFGDLKPRAS